MTLQRINLRRIELTEEADNTYCVAEFWRESTSKGSYKHQRVPYHLHVAKDYNEALDKLFDMATQKDNIVVDEEHAKGMSLRDNSKFDMEDETKAELVWEPGDRDVDLGDYDVRIVTIEELFEDYCPEPVDIERKKMGAGLDDLTLVQMQDLGAIVIHSEEED